MSMGEKRAFIIHGWQGYPEEGWFPWLKKELEQRGWEVIVPAMPRPESPDIHAWVETLAQLVETPDTNTILIGHSIGCQTIMRYLEALPETALIRGTIFVAGWFTLTNLETDDEKMIAQPWIEEPLDFNKIRAKMGHCSVILSDNDLWVPFEETKEMFEKNMNATVIVEHAKGHLSGGDGITILPSVLDEFLKISS